MNDLNSKSLKPTATASASAQAMRAMHVRPEANCQCGHDHGAGSSSALGALAKMLGAPDSVLKGLNQKHLDPKGGLTIAYQIDPLNDLINIGFSMCRDDEVYSRSIGFKTSSERIVTKDPINSFSVDIAAVKDHVLHLAKHNNDLAALSSTAIKTIRFQDLSIKAVEFSILEAVKARLTQIKLKAREELAEIKNEQAKRKAARKAAKAETSDADKIKAAQLMAQTLVQTNQIPPTQ